MIFPQRVRVSWIKDFGVADNLTMEQVDTEVPDDVVDFREYRLVPLDERGFLERIFTWLFGPASEADDDRS